MPSRRAILRTGAIGGVLASLAGCAAARPTPATGAHATYDFNQGWLFGGPYVPGCTDPGYDDRGFAQVTLPHTVTPLSWGNWDPASWEAVWIYRKHFGLPRGSRGRVFVDFDGVMVNATVLINGTTVSAYGGVGGTFVRSEPGRPGQVTVTAGHPLLGQASVRVTVKRP